MKNEYRSRVYTDRSAYADFEAPAKFLAIESIIVRRLKEHPKAICSYSGGSDSDILIDLRYLKPFRDDDVELFERKGADGRTYIAVKKDFS